MLSYYVLTGRNPLPNESMFADFPERVFSAICENYKFAWKCLPYLLRDTIINTTKADQVNRISLDTYINNLVVAKDMHLHNTIPNTHPLVLVELRQRIDSIGNEEVSDFGRTICIDYNTLSKRVKLSTMSARGQVIMSVSIERYTSSADQRDGIRKYFQRMKERALSAVKSDCFSRTEGECSEYNVVIKLTTVLPENLSLDYIDKLAANIREVRYCLDA